MRLHLATLKDRVFRASGIKNPKNIKKRLKNKFVFLKDDKKKITRVLKNTPNNALKTHHHSSHV
ncbi:hypothetical protein HpEKA49_11750 [Helicobacter pylori]